MNANTLSPRAHLVVASVVAASVLVGCVGPEPAAVSSDDEALRLDSDANDIETDTHGSVLDNLAQWSRDATVSVGHDHCTGTLVSPRVVVTAAHCLDWSGDYTVTFGPVDPQGAGGPLPLGTPRSFQVDVADCFADPVSQMGGAGCSQSCPDLFSDCAVPWGDIAVLILEERVDVGPRGTHPSHYRAVPAHLSESDPGLGTRVLHVGFGQMGLTDTRHRVFRQVAGEVLWSSPSEESYLMNATGCPGDSGGPIYRDDGSTPRVLLGDQWGGDGSSDRMVRVSHDDVRTWLEQFVGLASEHYPGHMLTVSAVGPTHPEVAGPPETEATVWTGPNDCPTVDEPADRRAFFSMGRSADQLDPDGDGLIGAHDNCWGIYNPLQHVRDGSLVAACPPRSETATYTCIARTGTDELDGDTDGDDVPDACDNCIGVRNQGQADCDHDGIGDDCRCDIVGGIPDVNCELNSDTDPVPDQCDNCLMVANDQSNCNDDAEILRGVRPRGDACDDQPCASGWIENHPSGAPRIADVLIPVDGTALASTSLETGFRFCPCAIARGTIGTRALCDTFIDAETGGGCARAAPSLYLSRRTIEPTDWRFVTFDGLDTNGEHRLDYDLTISTTYTAHWDVSGTDRPRWVATMGAIYPGTVPPETPIAGVMWHRTLAPSGFVSELTNHYSSNLVAQSNTGGSGIALPPVGVMAPILPLPMSNDFCPYCGDWLPVPWLVLPCGGGGGCSAVDPASPAIALGGRLFTPGAEPTFDPPGFNLFASSEPVRWAAVAESLEVAPEGTLRFVGLSANGAVPVRLLATVGGTLQTFLKSNCGPGQCIGYVAADGIASDSSTPGSARGQPDPPRSNYAMTASAHWASAWVAGGTGPDGAQLHEIWRFGALTGTWHQVETDINLGRIHAVAYSPSDAQLYVVDEVESRHSGTVRLLRLPPEGGHAVVELSWRRTCSTDVVVLTMDANGDLWLGASQAHRGAHDVVRFTRDRHGSLAFAGRAVGAGGLQPGGAYASRRGLSLAVRVGHRVEIVAYARRDLVPRGTADGLF